MGDLKMADFDVIVVGSGMSGGWVAKEMCEKGFKVAVLERGRDIVPVEDYTDMVDPWDMEHLNQKSPSDYADYPVQSEVPEGQEYKWRRGYHTGGRSIMWGRQSYRLSEIDFEANKKDGHGVDWPLRYKDIAPWYDYVEKFAGISGSKEGLDILPDSVFQKPHDLSCGEKVLKEKVEAAFPGRKVIP